MNRTKFVLNQEGVRDLLRSDEMAAIVDEKARAIQSRCGEGYERDNYVGKNRVNAMVYADTYEAKRDNLENNTILKAIR